MLSYSSLCIVVATAVVATLSAASGQPQPSAIRAQPIAKAAHFGGTLEVREVGIGEVSKSFGTPLWAVRVTAGTRAFADLNVVLVKRGSYLTPEVIKRFEQASSAEAQRVRLADGRRGYCAVLGVTRDDTTYTAALPSPDGEFELIVSVAVPFAPPTPPLEAARHQILMQNEPLDTVAAIALSIYRQLFSPPRHQDTRRTIE